jgi:hypothetical protein
MFALVATTTISRESLMDTSNRNEETALNRRIAPWSGAPDLLAEPAAFAPWPSTLEEPAERQGLWGRFFTALRQALAAWPT